MNLDLFFKQIFSYTDNKKLCWKRVNMLPYSIPKML